MTRQQEVSAMNEPAFVETTGVGQTLGGKRVVRDLGRHGLARRYLGHDLRRRVDCLIYVFDDTAADALERTWDALRAAVGQRRSHTLPVEEIGRERGGCCWAASPYPGNHEAIVTLDGLRRSKGGRFSQHETARAIEQLLGAVSSSHGDGWVHGPIAADEVVVNPRGSLFIELYGLKRRIMRAGLSDEARQDEVRSVVALAWTLLTGIDAGERDVFAGQVGRSVDRRWMQWIERGLDPIMGFCDADEAIAALPGNNPSGADYPAGGARALIGRLSSVVTQRKETRARWSRKKQGLGEI